MATAVETLRDTPFTIGGRTFHSRLMVGTGKYQDNETMVRAVEASGAEIVTVAVRRVDLDRTKRAGVLYHLDPKRYFLLANTAGCATAQDAVRYARLAREAGFNEFVKLEVIGDQETLLPDVQGLLEAASILVREGFKVLAYTNEDLVAALRLEDAGVADRERARAPQSVQRAHYQAAAAGARGRRRRRRDGLGRLPHHGARRGRHPDEHRPRRRTGSGCDGARDAPGGRGGPNRVPRRTHGAARGGGALLAARRDAGLRTPPPPGARRCGCFRRYAPALPSRRRATGISPGSPNGTGASPTNSPQACCVARPISSRCSRSRPPILGSTTSCDSAPISCARSLACPRMRRCRRAWSWRGRSPARAPPVT